MSDLDTPEGTQMGETEQEVIDQFDEEILDGFEVMAESVEEQGDVPNEVCGEEHEYTDVMESEEIVASEDIHETEEEVCTSVAHGEADDVTEMVENPDTGQPVATEEPEDARDTVVPEESFQAVASPFEETPDSSRLEQHDEPESKTLETVSDRKAAAASLRRSSRSSMAKTPNENSPSGRTTRSQNNPGLLAKQKSFIQKYQIAVKGPMEEYTRSTVAADTEAKAEAVNPGSKRKWEDSGGDVPSAAATVEITEKKAKRAAPTSVRMVLGHFLAESEGTSTITRHDRYCWMCHLDGQVLSCSVCPRVFHQRCIQQQAPPSSNWTCPECVSIRNAEKTARLNGEQLAMMLGFALERIKSVADSEPFTKPVDVAQFQHYPEYVVCPMDLGMLEERVQERLYRTTRAFMADCRWILHNCAVFNTPQSKLTAVAKTVMKVCRHEMGEIDTCPDCYVHAHTKRETWFVEPCRKPHLLLWAKLKGFPHWPAKAMKANKEGNVDVRFFGAHDRAWVPIKDCFLYSEETPVSMKNKRKANLDSSIKEVERHVKKLAEKFGEFRHAPARTVYNPQKEDEQLLLMLPNYKPPEEAVSTPPKKSKTAAQQHKQEEGVAEAAEEAPTPVAAESTVAAAPSATAAPEEEERETAPPPREDDCNFMALLQLAPRSAAPATSASSTVTTASSDSIPRITVSSTVAPRTAAKSSVVAKPKPAAQENSCPKLKPKAQGDDKNTTDAELKRIQPDKPAESNNNVENENNQSSAEIKMEPMEEDEPPNETAEAKDNNESDVTIVPAPNEAAAEEKAPEAVEEPPAAVESETGADEEEDLDPAMYLDPTITITLVNHEGEKSKATSKGTSSEVGISSSDLQALNALGENVSITVVPRKKDAAKSSSGGVKVKESDGQPLVVEVDPTAVAKPRGGTAPQAKARKSIQKPRVTQQPQPVQSKPKLSTPPMVAIPSRQLNIESAAKRTLQPAPPVSRVPSITVRPVAQLASSQPSIILQTGSATSGAATELSPAPVGVVTVKNVATSASTTAPTGALTLGAVQTIAADSAFGSGGLLLTFNRPVATLPSISTASSTIKDTSNSLTSLLASKTQQMAEMMKNSIESLLQELGAAGNYEATALQLRLELERLRWSHQQEMEELKRGHEKQLSEARLAAEADKQLKLGELRKEMEAEKQRAIDEAKKKQWCAQCGQEAIFYCCWNTAYCDYPCQQSHWPKHMATCANANQNSSSSEAAQETAAKATAAKSSSGSQRADSPAADEDRNDVHPALLFAGVTSKNQRLRRRRCGTCPGCLVTANCGECVNCRSVNSHRVCKKRMCASLIENQPAQPSTPPPQPPQNNVVNGSQKKSSKTGATQLKSDLGYTVIPSPDVTVTVAPPASSQGSTRIATPTVAAQQVLSAGTPITLLVTAPSKSTMTTSLSIPIIQCVRGAAVVNPASADKTTL